MPIAYGVGLIWKVTECEECEKSGGRCGFDMDAYSFRCYSHDGDRLVRFHSSVIECEECEKSGGRCGFHMDAYSFRCYCHDGDRLVRCHSSGPSLSHSMAKDVYYLTGLPINGKAVIGHDYGLDTLCFELLGKINYFTVTNQRRKNCIKLRQLRIDFQNVDDDVNYLELDKYVRAYVLYVIGCVISVDETNDNVPAMYLSFLENVNEIGSYAWGSVLLVNINYWLVKYKRNPTDHGVKAMLFFVQLFAFERFEWLRENTYRQPLNSPLAGCTPTPNREELKLTGVDTLVLCMNKVAWHRPSFIPRQLWCPTVPLDPYPLNIKPRSGKGLDWSLQYDGYVREWDQRNQRFMELSMLHKQMPMGWRLEVLLVMLVSVMT
ncbi:serine/threonine-protein phosphatase 7 long form-like protein [Senna tora]|uniref:Serine/threonine-protein phosphatase 7 long form-like protein n=1 Tax=Senna tora TaxID=362788 RepID=A0A834TUJ0_9FABA|nr:serine/threonine-protein phosphatase 7 long form-like protein [Senna tora]